MNVGKWKAEKKFENDAITAKVITSEDSARIELKKCGYSAAYAVSETLSVSNDKNYIFDSAVICEEAECKILAIWYKDGKEQFLEYITSSYTLSPKMNADSIKIGFLVYGFSGGFAEISNVRILEKEKNKRRKIKVAALAIDYGFVWEHKNRSCEDNLRDSLNRIDALYKNDKPDLVVLTECFYSRITSVKYEKTFLSVNSEQIKKMQDKARELKIFISFSFREIAENGYFYNSALLINREGEIIANYHKSHLTICEKIKGLVPGDGTLVVDTELGRISFAICWDMYFPEFIRQISMQGAEIIINPTAGFHEDMNIMRAKDNEIYIISAGVYRDGCAIITPEGKRLGNANCTGAAVAEIDLDELFPVQRLSADSYTSRRNVYHNEMRKDLYKY